MLHGSSGEEAARFGSSMFINGVVSRAASLVGACVLFRSRRFAVSDHDHRSIRVHRVIYGDGINVPNEWLESIEGNEWGRSSMAEVACCSSSSK